MEYINEKRKQSLGKFISLILRHKPQVIGIQLDKHGWADVQELIEGMCKYGKTINREILQDIVDTDAKQRYSFNKERTLIRANQGHSIPVDVELVEQQPPKILYHGTAEGYLIHIWKEGLKPMSRLYVHLSKDESTALQVGKRHGKPVILKVDAEKMTQEGYSFYLSENGVWLTKEVPIKYLSKKE